MTTKRLSSTVLLFGSVIALLTIGCQPGQENAIPDKPNGANKSSGADVSPDAAKSDAPKDVVKSGTYVLRFPAFQEKASGYEGAIRKHDLALVVRGKRTLLLPVEKDRGFRWFHLRETSGKKQKAKGWIFKRDEKGQVSIAGYLGIAEAVFRVEMYGQTTGDGGWKGKAATVMGTGVEVMTLPLHYHFQWSLTPKDQNVPEISNKVTYDGPPSKTVPAKGSSQVDIERLRRLRPPSAVLAIKSYSYGPPVFQEQFVRELSKDARKYLKAYVLSELTWKEIQVVPGIIILSDHIAGLDVADQGGVADSYVRDGSARYLKDYSYADLRRIPPAFLLVHCYPKLGKAARATIKEGSTRFALIFEETEKHKDAPVNALDEIMAAVLTKMSAEDRANYFRTSAKLKPYVAASKHEALRALLP